MNKIIRSYALLVRLYPRKFRDKFADEMQSVFADSIAEAAQRGLAALIALCLQELRDLPGAILREHWQARSKSIMEKNRACHGSNCCVQPFHFYSTCHFL